MLENCFYYYGAVIPIAEVSARMHSLKSILRQDIYCYILDNKLHYRRVGNVHRIYRIVIGRELHVADVNKYD